MQLSLQFPQLALGGRVLPKGKPGTPCVPQTGFMGTGTLKKNKYKFYVSSYFLRGPEENKITPPPPSKKKS